MKSILVSILAAVLVVGCGESQPTAKAPRISIYKAASIGNVAAVKQHIAAGTDVNGTSLGATPLHFAATHRVGQYSHKNKEIVELLIAAGADLNVKDRGGRTPLEQAEKGFENLLPEGQAAMKEIADIIRKHGGKTGEELKAEGK
jgi:hypothetical protein